MKGNFGYAMELLWPTEGGFSDDPYDNAHAAGKCTNLGITQITLERWRGRSVTKEEMQQLTKGEATEIYKTWYWHGVHGDTLPAGIDICMFDFGVNASVERSVRFAQQIVGSTPDGIMGPNTLAKIKAYDQKLLIKEFAEARLDYYQLLEDWDRYKNGWTKRTIKFKKAGLAMLEELQQVKDIVKEAVREEASATPQPKPTKSVTQMITKGWRPASALGFLGILGTDKINPDLLNLSPTQTICLTSIIGIYMIMRTVEKIFGRVE